MAHELAEALIRGDEAGAHLARAHRRHYPEMEADLEPYLSYIYDLELFGADVYLEQRFDLREWVPEAFGTTDALVISGPATATRVEVID